jgi:hypothetical protein
MTRVHHLVRLFFESEVKLILEFLDSYQPLIKVAKELGTVYRDREHYGTTSRGADRSPQHPGIESATPKEVIDSLNETVYREAFLDLVISARDLRTKLEEISIFPRENEVREAPAPTFTAPEGWWKEGEQWFRPQTLEEYNASLERAFVATAAPHSGPGILPRDPVQLRMKYREHLALTVQPEWISEYDTDAEFEIWVGAALRKGWLDLPPANPSPAPVFKPVSEVPQDAGGIAVSPPLVFPEVTLEEPVQSPTLDWYGLENLWASFRAIETEFAALPFPRNIQTRVSEGKPPTSESKMLKRWYRYSSTFRATVDPINGNST